MIDAPEPSWRKPVGMLAILAIIGVWAVLVVSAIDAFDLHPLVQGVAYLAGGIAWLWLFPMRRMLAWMETGRWRR